MSGGGQYDGLRKRRRNGSFIPRSVLRARYLSYSARGILANLLDRPPNWQVRAEVLAHESDKDGVEKVKTALRELRQHGHYRLERRRGLDGRYLMGTAISEDPVQDWIDQYTEYGKNPIPVVQQRDGAWWVRHEDGTFTPDDFDGFDEPATSDDADPDATGSAPAAENPVAGNTLPAPAAENPLPAPAGENPLPGNPAPASLAPGFTDAGSPAALRDTETENRDGFRSAWTSSQQNGARRAAANGTSPNGTSVNGTSVNGNSRRPPPPGAKGTRRKDRSPEEQERFDAGSTIVTAWLQRCSERGPVVGNVRVGLRDGLVVPALTACMTAKEPLTLDHAIARVTRALEQCGDVMPAKFRFQRAMMSPNGHSERPPWATNLHVDRDIPDGDKLF